jgi:hypothetical protein
VLCGRDREAMTINPRRGFGSAGCSEDDTAKATEPQFIESHHTRSPLPEGGERVVVLHVIHTARRVARMKAFHPFPKRSAQNRWETGLTISTEQFRVGIWRRGTMWETRI